MKYIYICIYLKGKKKKRKLNFDYTDVHPPFHLNQSISFIMQVVLLINNFQTNSFFLFFMSIGQKEQFILECEENILGQIYINAWRIILRQKCFESRPHHFMNMDSRKSSLKISRKFMLIKTIDQIELRKIWNFVLFKKLKLFSWKIVT